MLTAIDPTDDALRCALTRAVLTTYDARTRQPRPMTDEEWAAAWPIVRRDPNTSAAVDRILDVITTHGPALLEERGVLSPGPGSTPEIRPAPHGTTAASYPAGRGGRKRWVTPWRPS